MSPPESSRVPEPPSDSDPREILRLGIEAADGPVALACSFSAEDVVVLDFLLEVAPAARVFALDTGRLNEETYEVAEAVRRRYGVTIEWHFPRREKVERLERGKGLHSFRESLENRHECCRIRKVEPLARALTGLSGWVTGLRREQGVTRTDVKPVERDEAHGGLLKINPLLEWRWDEVWTHVQEKRLPVNRLYGKGYPSIGCAPCTRAVGPGEHPRAGRWWWERPEHKECGLHRP
ncbi:MAG: phosphoadenylyl-sulfate reductase [Deltaproteobacteria bacterium]|nr:phosphoadenylyl-sulfate reductase [Deltaproteobacteria bacterium]